MYRGYSDPCEYFFHASVKFYDLVIVVVIDVQPFVVLAYNAQSYCIELYVNYSSENWTFQNLSF